MSDFKFACPVCGQHMRCDVAEGGSVMECPTCFQKIVAPQAPAADGKFILTGTKFSEKKISVRGMDPASAVAAPEKEFPAKIFIIVLVVCSSLGIVNMTLGVIGHEGSTVIVVLNGLRLLFTKKE